MGETLAKGVDVTGAPDDGGTAGNIEQVRRQEVRRKKKKKNQGDDLQYRPKVRSAASRSSSRTTLRISSIGTSILSLASAATREDLRMKT